MEDTREKHIERNAAHHNRRTWKVMTHSSCDSNQNPRSSRSTGAAYQLLTWKQESTALTYQCTPAVRIVWKQFREKFSSYL